MDALEARLQFIQVLKNLYKTLNTNKESTDVNSSGLNGQSNGPVGPVQFYLNNYTHHYEDFHQCLLDTTKKMNALDRLPVLLYYSIIIQTLQNIKSESSMKVLNDVLLPSIDQVFQLILPRENVQSLTNWSICNEIFTELKKKLNISTTAINNNPLTAGTPWFELINFATTTQESFDNVSLLLQDREIRKQQMFESYRTNLICMDPVNNNKISSDTIINRMEMDRERHKRAKEQNWFVDRPDKNFLNVTEFNNLWDSIGKFNTIDARNVKELNQIASQSYTSSTS